MTQSNQVRLLITLNEISEACEWKKTEDVQALRDRLNNVMKISNMRLAEFEKPNRNLGSSNKPSHYATVLP